MGELVCSNILCHRDGFALHIDSLVIGQGEKIALLGENGCGKTTLLQVLTGILPAEGAIHYQGTRWDKLTPEQRAQSMSYLPQEASVLFNLSVAELISLRLSDTEGLAQKECLAILQALELADMQERCFHSLSGGEKRRAMLARIFCRGSELLFLDEPTAPLDMRHAASAMRYAALSKQTVLAALHDVNLALRYFDRFLLMKEGRILFDKRKSDLALPDLEETYGVQLNAYGGFFFPKL